MFPPLVFSEPTSELPASLPLRVAALSCGIAFAPSPMQGFANKRDMDTPVYGREKVSATVTGDATANRHAVARAVCERLPILRHRLPEARRLWQSEDNRQRLFDAAALGITHHVLTHPRL